MIKRIIFDLDCTLLTGDFSAEQKLFSKVFTKEESLMIKDKILKVVSQYEKEYDKYDIKLMSDYISKKLNVDFNEDIVKAWIINNSECIDYMSPDLVDTLKYLKEKGYSLAVLTNWFKDTQETRLKNNDIYKYFDLFVYGEDAIKPHKESYLKASNGFKPEECIIIGDDIDLDVLEPNKYGLKSIWYNPNSLDNNYGVTEIKEFIELKNML